ncbi:MAG: M1 family metallopeptidase [Saprospiraceae bacterium]|nr:M1 family metallopeptidase [Saprospiraceae bacterium]
MLDSGIPLYLGMRISLGYWTFIFLFIFNANNQLAAQALSPRIANYQIDLELFPVEKMIRADQFLTWTNPGKSPVTELQFHLYYNAFRNTKSTFYKDQDGIARFGNFELKDECTWAWMEITLMEDQTGADLRPGMEYIHPDDDNEDDMTVLRVPLLEPIPPGETRVFKMKWESKIPIVRARTGTLNDFFHFAQWFPKVGVYETAGTRYATEDSWNCHQYHASGEYYSEFGNYKVTMKVPNDFEVGSSGKLINKEASGEKTSWTFIANDVIDFAWSCSPHFIRKVDKYKDVELTLLTYDDHPKCWERYFDIVKNGFSFLEEHVGDYPYSTFTVIDPPLHGLFVGGMEYPTLITSINLCFLPNGLRTTETLTTHELIHQYFMQMVATHEVEEPWMDEGFTTYYEGRILDHYFGDSTSFVDWSGWQIGNGQYNRAEFFAADNVKIAENSRKSWEYKHGGYGEVSYNKTAIWLKTLEGLVGLETMDEIMKTYFQRWKFKHPKGQDFFHIASEVTRKNHGDRFGEDLNWYFDQVVYGTDVCDYEVASIENLSIPKASGFINGTEECESTLDQKEEYTLARTIIHRLGELKLPQEILITFSDGSSKTEYWDGKDRSVDFSYPGNLKIVCVDIDPDRKIQLDYNFLNNQKCIEPDAKGIRYLFQRFFITCQNALQTLSLLI